MARCNQAAADEHGGDDLQCGVRQHRFNFSFRRSHFSDIFMAKLVLMLSCGQRPALSTGWHARSAMNPKTRLVWLKLYEETGDAGLVCRRCGISRPTLR